MATLRMLFTVLIMLSGILYWLLPQANKQRWSYILKPAAMLLVIGVALTSWHGGCSYSAWIVAGLVVSLIGDILLMLPSDRFFAGMIAFLGAQLCYIAAFTNQQALGNWASVVLLLLAIYVVTIYRLCLLGLFGEPWPLQVGVAVYACTLAFMVWRALQHGNDLASAGALLFLASDTLIGWNRFVTPLKYAEFGVISLYIAAQYTLALSLAWC